MVLDVQTVTLIGIDAGVLLVGVVAVILAARALRSARQSEVAAKRTAQSAERSATAAERSAAVAEESAATSRRAAEAVEEALRLTRAGITFEELRAELSRLDTIGSLLASMETHMYAASPRDAESIDRLRDDSRQLENLIAGYEGRLPKTTELARSAGPQGHIGVIQAALQSGARPELDAERRRVLETLEQLG
jgi:hypothetical protein